MEVRLVLVSPPQHTRAVSVSLPAVVGRGGKATLRIPQESVSRRHCEIFAMEGAVFIRDLGSTNGTQIGTDTISASAAVTIESGSVIRVGDATFRVEYAPVATHREPPAGSVVEEPAPAAVRDDAGMPALPDAVPTLAEPVEQPPTGFEFTAPDELPATNDTNLDDFLKGLQ
jgi:pSer/pThr/pTyr-binding forkhead associated (FHA) protein